MAEIRYDIPTLVALASHIQYFPELAVEVNNLLRPDSPEAYEVAVENAVSIIQANREFSGEYTSQFGLPVFMPFIIEQYSNDVEELFLESAVVKTSQAKNIVETTVQGRDGEVNEFINNRSYVITVKGIICNTTYGYPLDQVEQFKEYMTTPQSLSVVHELLNMLGVHEIIITNFDLLESPFINCQPYEFTCKSTQQLALRIDEDANT